LDEFVDRVARREQFDRVCQLKEYYGIEGKTGWRPWYELALAIASELDDGLKIIDPRPEGRTTPKWRGAPGEALLNEVAALKEGNPNWSVRRCLHQMQKWGAYGNMSLDALCTRYSEAQKFHAPITKRRSKKKAAS